MVKTLTTVGNSKAIILPSALVKRFKLKKVTIEATDSGILIKPFEAEPKNLFQRKMASIRKNKEAIYKLMEKEASDKRTISFYSNEANRFDNVDLAILES
jgi:antitoxin component of MazEF toxin-antitoxin module